MSEGYPLEELASLPTFYRPAASPDGEEVAAYYDGSGRNELYVVDPETGEMTRVERRRGALGRATHSGGTPAATASFSPRRRRRRAERPRATRPGRVSGALVENDDQCLSTDVSEDGRRLLYVSDVGRQLNLCEYDRSTGESTRLTTYDRPVERPSETGD